MAWLELAGLNVTGGTDAGLRYAGGYSQRGLVEVTSASNVVLSNCTVSLVSRQKESSVAALETSSLSFISVTRNACA